MQRLDDCPHDNPSLDELAHESGLSRRHLTRLFRAEMGISVHQYQVQAKVRTAYALIRRGRRPPLQPQRCPMYEMSI